MNESSQRSQSTWGLVAGASLISTGLAAYEIVPASVTPLIRDSLNIGPTTAGLLVGIMFGTAVITSLPAGAVLDRTNTRNAMAVAVIILFLAGIWGWMAGRSGDYRAVIASSCCWRRCVRRRLECGHRHREPIGRRISAGDCCWRVHCQWPSRIRTRSGNGSTRRSVVWLASDLPRVQWDCSRRISPVLADEPRSRTQQWR